MAHSNSTQYYNLPQFDSTDKPAWLVDVNPAYAAIDTGIHAAKAAADAAQGDATQALSDASSAGTTASGADAKAAGSIASLADAFDTTATYEVDDLVIYNNLLYICTTAVDVPGAWTGLTNWARTTLEAEINKKQNTLTEGTGIDITNDTISADLSEGSGIDITGNTISVDVDSLTTSASISVADVIPVSVNGTLMKTTPSAITKASIITEDITITSGNTLYFGYYYGDSNITYLDKTIIGIIPYKQPANKPFHVQRMQLGNAVRIWTTDPNTECIVRIVYLA